MKSKSKTTIKKERKYRQAAIKDSKNWKYVDETTGKKKNIVSVMGLLETGISKDARQYRKKQRESKGMGFF